jgi:hypothetical protein
VPAYRRSALAFAQLGNSGFHSRLAVEEKQRELMEKERDLQAQAANVASLETSVAAAGKRHGPGDKALVRLDWQQLETNGKLLPLNAGMQVVAEIHQGRRTVMAYLLSPVQKAWQEAARER